MGYRENDAPAGSSSFALQTLDGELPPPYQESDDIPTSLSATVLPEQPLRLINSVYTLPGASIVDLRDKRIITLEPTLCRNSNELYNVICGQVKLPPRPLYVIEGWHSETSRENGNKKQSAVVDFHIELDLAETLLSGWEGTRLSAEWRKISVVSDADNTPEFRGGILRSSSYKAPKLRQPPISLSDDSDAALLGPDSDFGIPEDSEDISGSPDDHYLNDLRLWCDRFCNDPSPVKSFTLNRHTEGINFPAIQEVFDLRIRGLNYQGKLKHSTHMAQSSVTIYSPHWINRLRTNKYAWWIVVLLQLWIITWPIILLLERRYEVVNTTWYSSFVSGPAGLSKRYARGYSETALAEYWTPAVKRAAWTRRNTKTPLTRLDVEHLSGLSEEQILGIRATTVSVAEQDRLERVNRGEAGFVDNIVGLVRGINEARVQYTLQSSFASGWGGNT